VDPPATVVPLPSRLLHLPRQVPQEPSPAEAGVDRHPGVGERERVVVRAGLHVAVLLDPRLLVHVEHLGVGRQVCRELLDERSESAVTRARNAMFEMVVGAHLAQLDPSIAFAEPDVVLRFDGIPAAVACKRPFGSSGLLALTEEAAGQLAKWRVIEDGIGIIAISADRIVSPEPGRFILEVPTEADARVQLDSAIATLLPTVAETLDRIGAKHVNAVLIQASAPAVIGDRGLNRFSQTTGLYREHHAGVDPESLIARVQGCFRLM